MLKQQQQKQAMVGQKPTGAPQPMQQFGKPG
jgi:hypothetical protein